MNENRYEKNFFIQYKDLLKKIFFTLGILAIYKIIDYIVIPGINLDILSKVMNSSNFFKSLELYMGGDTTKISILSLSVTPYINASIMMQLLTSKFGGFISFMKLKEDGEFGRQKISEYTQYATLLFAIVFSITYTLYTCLQVVNNVSVVYINKGLFFAISVPSLIAGAFFSSWLGSLIQKHGIGSGVSVIMCTNIIVKLPKNLKNLFNGFSFSNLNLVILSITSLIFIFLFIIFLENTIHKVKLKYSSQYKYTYFLPIKFNNPGIMPSIFVGQISSVLQSLCSSLMNAGVEISLLKKIVKHLQDGSVLNSFIQIFLIIYFTFVCSEFSFNSEENAKHLNESGAIINSLQPGKKTIEYLDSIIFRLNFLTGLYLAIVCVIFDVFAKKFNLTISGSSILIMITTITEIIRQSYSYFVSKKTYSFVSMLIK